MTAPQPLRGSFVLSSTRWLCPSRLGWPERDESATRQAALGAVRVAGSAIALSLLLALAGCGPERTKTVPSELIGVWKTQAPDYADRFLELTRDSIRFGTGGDEFYVRSIVGVEKALEDGSTLYTVFYIDPADPEKYQYKVAFYYDPGNQGVIRYKNRTDIVWTKTSS